MLFFRTVASGILLVIAVATLEIYTEIVTVVEVFIVFTWVVTCIPLMRPTVFTTLNNEGAIEVFHIQLFY